MEILPREVGHIEFQVNVASLFISDFNLPLSPRNEIYIGTLIRYLLVNAISCLWLEDQSALWEILLVFVCC